MEVYEDIKDQFECPRTGAMSRPIIIIERWIYAMQRKGSEAGSTCIQRGVMLEEIGAERIHEFD